MKKIASQILALVLLLGYFLTMTQDAVADTVYQTSGDGKTTVTFYVKSNGKSSVTLKQTKGLHQGFSLTSPWDAFTGKDDQWGQYHIDIYSPSGSRTRNDWADYFYGSTHKLTFSSAGVYRVVITPYSQNEMRDAHPLAFWGNWDKQPQWWVDSYSNCSISTSSNITTSPVTASVTIRCVDSSTNEILRSFQEKVSEGTNTFNAPSISGYTAIWPSYQTVSLLNNGTVSPSVVVFKYVKDSSVGNSNSNVTARITVEGVNAVTNEVLYREYKDLKPGTTTIAARNLSDAYYFSGASSANVYVSQDGTAGQSVVRFYYTPKTTTGNGGSTGTGSYVTTPPVITQPPHHGNSNSPYNIGVPNLNGKVYYENDMNVHVLWVHYQLKATGQYYQGDNWDETGNLGNTTMKEIARFMKANGHPNHNGRVDQTVINTFANYLGNRVVPIYAGGYYDKMNTIMSGGSAGSMQSIDEYSSYTKIKWVQTCLKKLGYYTSSIDGKFGSGTINALKRFQSDYGYVQRDYVSLGVARAMLEACYNRGCSLDDLP